MQPRRTVLDARTASIVTRFASKDADLATLPLSTLGTRFVTTGRIAGTPSVSPDVTLKLLVDRGAEKDVTSWIESQGGKIISQGERVLVANLNVAKISRLTTLSGLRRVEAPQEFHVALEKARGKATRLDEALKAPGAATGKGVDEKGRKCDGTEIYEKQ